MESVHSGLNKLDGCHVWWGSPTEGAIVVPPWRLETAAALTTSPLAFSAGWWYFSPKRYGRINSASYLHVAQVLPRSSSLISRAVVEMQFLNTKKKTQLFADLV